MTVADLVVVSDFISRRTRARLDGLTDDELLWEPAAGCWSVRRSDDGSWRPDGGWPPPDPAPFTTMAWRLAHLTTCYGGSRNAALLGRPAATAGFEPLDPAAGAASVALARLAAAHDVWRGLLTSMSDAELDEPIGEVGGQYAAEPRLGYVLHMLDEFSHHGAEVALLRDLWRAKVPG